MKNIFSLDHELVGRLDAVQATKAFRNLLWCEARRIGLSPHRIIISLRSTVSDGGIDARVDGLLNTDSALVSGVSYFQIKTGQGFKPWQISSLKKELFGGSKVTPARKALASEVRECMRSRGRYVIVCFGHDFTTQQQSGAKRALVQLFKMCGFKKPHVDVLGQSQFLSLMVAYPSLTLDLGGKGETPFLSISSWLARSDMKYALHLATAQSEFVNAIRSAIRGVNNQHVRVIGEPGIGKTRLVLEALSVDDLASEVIYISNAEDFQNSRLLNELIRGDVTYSVTLVIDECVEKERTSIWSALKGKSGIKLVTIDHGPERTGDEGMLVLECPRLPEDQIRTIIAQYLPKHADASHWARWCDGIPRVAHAVGENLERNPDDLLKPPATVPIWERFVAGYEELASKNAQDALTVLRHAALFTRFGFDEPVSNEAKFIATLAQAVDPSITWGRFQEIVERLRDRRILQGKRTLFIVPKALHIHLWVGYWNVYGRGFDFKTFFDKVPEQLQHWFLQLFIYGHASPVAQSVIANVLSANGPFSSREFLESKAGCRFLSHLAEADPAGTMNTIERTIGAWSLDELRQREQGRQDIVWALEKIAVWPEHFLRVADVFIRLALAENAKNSNNSTGMLLGLFTIGVGWAATQASPAERFPAIKHLLESDDHDRKVLGLKLCTSWLSTYGGVRILGAEYQGLRAEIVFWRPKTWKEVFDAWRLVWNQVYSVSRAWDSEERSLANSTLIDAGAGLLQTSNVATEVMDTLFLLADDPATDVRHLTHMVIHKFNFHPRKMPKGMIGRLRALDDKLTGSSFWGRFCRFVLNTTWDEDYRERKGEIKESYKPSRRVQELVNEVAADRALLSEYLPKFVTVEGHRLYEFGIKLAAAIQTPELTEAVVSSQLTSLPELNTQFIGGYLAEVKSRDAQLWETVTLRLLDNDTSRNLGTAVIFSSGISGSVLTRLLELFRQGLVSPNAFSRFTWRASVEGASEGLVNDVVDTLVRVATEDALRVAIELAHDYYFDKQNPISCDEALVWRIITSALLLKEDHTDTMIGYHWRVVTEGFRKRFPDRDLDLLSAILPHLDSSHSVSASIADAIARDHPDDSWTIVSGYLDDDTKRGYWIISWLGDRIGFEEEPPLGAIRHFEPIAVMRWVSGDPEKNTRTLVRCLPKTLDETGGGKLTVLFLEMYGDDEKIASSLISHFWSGGRTGPESAHFAGKRDKARGWIKQAKSGRVLSWLYRYVEFLNECITDAEIKEEREF